MSEITRIRIPGTIDRYVRIEVAQDDNPVNPREEYDNAGTMVCFHRRYDLGDKNHGLTSDMFYDWDELETYLREEKNAVVVLPIYMYDHSGITISTTPFSCRWDSGQIGFIYISKEKAIEEWGNKICTKAVVEKATACLQAEVETYNQYLNGDVYGYQVQTYRIIGEETLDSLEESDWDDYSEEIGEEDSCWGYYGSDYAEVEAKRAAYGMVLDWMTPEAIEEELRKSCECDEERTGTFRRGPSICLTCYIKRVVNGLWHTPGRLESSINRYDLKAVALYVFQLYTEYEDEEMLNKFNVPLRVCKTCWGMVDECTECGGTGYVSTKGQLQLV